MSNSETVEYTSSISSKSMFLMTVSVKIRKAEKQPMVTYSLTLPRMDTPFRKVNEKKSAITSIMNGATAAPRLPLGTAINTSSSTVRPNSAERRWSLFK